MWKCHSQEEPAGTSRVEDTSPCQPDRSLMASRRNSTDDKAGLPKLQFMTRSFAALLTSPVTSPAFPSISGREFSAGQKWAFLCTVALEGWLLCLFLHIWDFYWPGLDKRGNFLSSEANFLTHQGAVYQKAYRAVRNCSCFHTFSFLANSLLVKAAHTRSWSKQ